jgi:uncharacterized protein (TIGR03000 family)
MYSVVLMMALSGSADVPAFGHRHGCNGCEGGGCYGGESYGCSGGGHHRHHRSHGCHGGCSGYSSGCGCCGSAGYGYGGGCYGASASYCDGCGGATYSAGCYGGAGYGGAAGPAVMPPAPPSGTKPEGIKPPKGDKGTLAPAPAVIFVSLPAGAKLTIDDAVTQSTSSVRAFASPALEQGKDFYYTLKAEIVRDGKTVTASKRVAVRAGEETRVSLEFPVSVAAK